MLVLVVLTPATQSRADQTLVDFNDELQVANDFLAVGEDGLPESTSPDTIGLNQTLGITPVSNAGSRALIYTPLSWRPRSTFTIGAYFQYITPTSSNRGTGVILAVGAAGGNRPTGGEEINLTISRTNSETEPGSLYGFRSSVEAMSAKEGIPAQNPGVVRVRTWSVEDGDDRQIGASQSSDFTSSQEGNLLEDGKWYYLEMRVRHDEEDDFHVTTTLYNSLATGEVGSIVLQNFEYLFTNKDFADDQDNKAYALIGGARSNTTGAAVYDNLRITVDSGHPSESTEASAGSAASN